METTNQEMILKVPEHKKVTELLSSASNVPDTLIGILNYLNVVLKENGKVEGDTYTNFMIWGREDQGIVKTTFQVKGNKITISETVL